MHNRLHNQEPPPDDDSTFALHFHAADELLSFAPILVTCRAAGDCLPKHNSTTPVN